jgi:hypothetical protein
MTLPLRRLLLAGLALLATAGCRTPCQSLCIEMADYAEECGFTVSDSDIDTCLDEQRDNDDQGSCRRVGAPDTLRTEWTCDDVRVFLQ